MFDDFVVVKINDTFLVFFIHKFASRQSNVRNKLYDGDTSDIKQKKICLIITCPQNVIIISKLRIMFMSKIKEQIKLHEYVMYSPLDFNIS